MLIRFERKIRDNQGVSHILLIMIVLIVFMVFNLLQAADKDICRQWFRRCEWGMQAGTKAAMVILESAEDNIQNVGTGFLTQNEDYNNYIKIKHIQAIESFFKIYYSSIKNPKIKKEDKILEKCTLIAIIEQKEDIYNISIYRQAVLEEVYSCNSLLEAEKFINKKLTNIEIFLYDDELRAVVDLENRSYFIAVTENLKLPNILDGSNINISYFEGSNIERKSSMRGDRL